MLKEFIKKILPPKTIYMARSSKSILDALSSYIYDGCRFLRYSTALFPPQTLGHLEANLLMHAHSLEKGLTLTDQKPGFGQDKIRQLHGLLCYYEKVGYPKNNVAYQAALSSIMTYKKAGKENEKIIDAQYEAHLQFCVESEDCTVLVTSKELTEKKFCHFDAFFKSRCSIRNFSGEAIDLDQIMDSIRLAQKAPSVCNRQSTKVYIVTKKERISSILKVQRGNKGFGHMADKLLIITSDLQAFHGIKERNAPYVDGGIFTMALLNALHFYNIGACTLNWSVKHLEDRKLRRVANLENSDSVICMIAIGSIPQKFKVCKSPRKNIEDVVRSIE